MSIAASVVAADFPCEGICVHGVFDGIGECFDNEVSIIDRTGLVEPLHRVCGFDANVSVDEVSPCGCVGIMLGDACVPFAIPHGYEAVGDIGVGPGKKFCFFDDCFHSR